MFQECDHFIINSCIPRDVGEHKLMNIFMEQECSHMTAQWSLGSAISQFYQIRVDGWLGGWMDMEST